MVEMPFALIYLLPLHPPSPLPPSSPCPSFLTYFHRPLPPPPLPAHPPSNSPEPSPGRILVQSHQRTLVTQRPGEPPRATTVTLIRATKVPEPGRVPEGSGMGRGPLPSVQICKKCNKRPANRGHTWCQECYSSS